MSMMKISITFAYQLDWMTATNSIKINNDILIQSTWSNRIIIPETNGTKPKMFNSDI